MRLALATVHSSMPQPRSHRMPMAITLHLLMTSTLLATMLGATIGWLWRRSIARVALAHFEQQMLQLRTDLEKQGDRTRIAETTLKQESERRVKLEQQLLHAETKAQDQRALLDHAHNTLTDTFKALSADALKNSNEQFIHLARATLSKYQEAAKGELELRQKAVGDLVTPIRESLDKVQGKLGELETARVSAYSALNEQMKGLLETHLPALHNETTKLVKALRQPTTRGRWGEIQLKRVVEMAGMLDHCDFLEQESRTTEDGRLRPDLIVRLPGGKQIVIDAKAPVSAYLDALEAPDEETRERLMTDHARQVRTHITQLSRKSYWENFQPTPEFVVLFMPGEVFFSAALQQDPSLIEHGLNEKVIPASPTTLIALLRAAAYGWREEKLAKNAAEVAELGKMMYSRLSTLAGHWNEVGKRLGQTVDSFNASVSSLESRVLVTARKFDALLGNQDRDAIEVVVGVEKNLRRIEAATEDTPGSAPTREARESPTVSVQIIDRQ